MKWKISACVCAITLSLTTIVNAQVVSLLVGNESGFNGIDQYNGTTGAHIGTFASAGSSGQSFGFLTYGPDNNLYVTPNAAQSPVLKFNGMTGQLIGTFVPSNGGNFTFGPDGNLYRVDAGGASISRYSGSTGQLLGTFVSSGLTAVQILHFGPEGDLFVGDINTVKRYNGLTGAFIGNFTPPGAGGIGAIEDFLFTPGGTLLVSGGSGVPNDKIFQFDGTTGAFLGNFAQGNGLNFPVGMTLGPDGSLYVANGGSGANDILHFNTANGNFLGNFVGATAHAFPRYLEFTPFPVPEPTSLLLSAAGAVFALPYTLRCLKRQPKLGS
jgi:hypothetical protein